MLTRFVNGQQLDVVEPSLPAHATKHHQRAAEGGYVGGVGSSTCVHKTLQARQQQREVAAALARPGVLVRVCR